MRNSFASVLLAVSLSVTVIAGVPLHSMVHHSHSSDAHEEAPGHHEQENAEWASLHSALKHEDKKLMFTAAAFALLLFLFAFAFPFRKLSLAAPLARLHRVRALAFAQLHPERGRFLRAGIAAHRKFV